MVMVGVSIGTHRPGIAVGTITTTTTPGTRPVTTAGITRIIHPIIIIPHLLDQITVLRGRDGAPEQAAEVLTMQDTSLRTNPDIVPLITDIAHLLHRANRA